MWSLENEDATWLRNVRHGLPIIAALYSRIIEISTLPLRRPENLQNPTFHNSYLQTVVYRSVDRLRVCVFSPFISIPTPCKDGSKGTKVPCTLGWPYTKGTWLYCDCFIWCVSCSVVVLTCFVMWVCFDNCVGVFVICVLVFIVFCIVCTVFLYCFVYVYLLFVLSVLV